MSVCLPKYLFTRRVIFSSIVIEKYGGYSMKMGCICDGIKSKCSSKVGPMEGYRETPPSLTQDEIAVVRNNWHVLKLYLANVGVNTFICLFESKPELQNIFKEFRGKGLREIRLTGLLRKHSLRVMATLDKCIIHLDDPAFMIPTLIELGIQHARYEVPISYLKFILPHFLNAIEPYIEEHWCGALELAWSKVFKWMLYHIGDGMLQYDGK